MKNKKLRDKVKLLNCAACGAPPPSDPEHFLNSCGLKERETEQNIWPCCRKCHILKNTLGRTTFVKKFKLYDYFYSRGFRFNKYSNSWYLPQNKN